MNLHPETQTLKPINAQSDTQPQNPKPEPLNFAQNQVRDPDSLRDPLALVPAIPDAQRLKNPDRTELDLEYLSEEARVISDFGVPIFVVSGSGVQVAGLTIQQRLAPPTPQLQPEINPKKHKP